MQYTDRQNTTEHHANVLGGILSIAFCPDSLQPCMLPVIQICKLETERSLQSLYLVVILVQWQFTNFLDNVNFITTHFRFRVQIGKGNSVGTVDDVTEPEVRRDSRSRRVSTSTRTFSTVRLER